MTTIKDFIIKFNLKNIELFEFNIDEVLSLKHNFLLTSLGVLPGESAYEILEAKVFLTLYFKDLTNQPKNILPVKKEIILIPSLLTCIDDKFIFNFTSVSTGLNISKKDLNKFLNESEEKLKRWSVLLLEGKITKEEFEWLVKSQKDILLLTSLKEAGISKIKLSNFKNQVISTIIKTVLTSII